MIDAKDNIEAEDYAIKLALELYPYGGQIYSDCQEVVKRYAPRVVWVPRESNKLAGNLRER